MPPTGAEIRDRTFYIKILFGKRIGVDVGDRSYPKSSCQALKAETVHLFCETRVVGSTCRAHDYRNQSRPRTMHIKLRTLLPDQWFLTRG